jgi:hypothetical protein
MAQPAVRSIGARRASGCHPSTSARTPEVSIPRASSLDHSPPTSGRWIRRPPHRRDGQESGTGLSHDGWGRCFYWKVSGVSGLAARDMLAIGGLSAERQGSRTPSERRGSSRRTQRVHRGHDGAGASGVGRCVRSGPDTGPSAQGNAGRFGQVPDRTVGGWLSWCPL